MSGQVIYRGEETSQGAWQAILDGETQARLGAVLRDPKRRVQASTVRRYPLSGALRSVSASVQNALFARAAHALPKPAEVYYANVLTGR